MTIGGLLHRESRRNEGALCASMRRSGARAIWHPDRAPPGGPVHVGFDIRAENPRQENPLTIVFSAGSIYNLVP